MDIFCGRCQEPMDRDELHDIPGMSFTEARKVFYDPAQGCGKLFSNAPCENRSTGPRVVTLALLEQEFGNDPDMIDSFMEDLIEAGEI